MKMFVKLMIRLYYLIMFRVSVEGLENYPLKTGKILCPNHINYHDPVIIGAFLPDYIQFMAKKETFKYRIFNPFLYFLGGFPVDREGNDIGAIRTSLRILKNKQGLLIFAEGTRNKTATPLRAKSGVALLAVKAQVPIIPITIDSTYKFFSPIKIVFHPPVTLETLYDTKPSQERLQEETQKVLEKVYDSMVYYKGWS